MKILFFCHWGFFDNESLRNGWIFPLTEQLTKFGYEIDLFDSEKHKIKDYQLVHIFSRADSETWPSIALEQKVVVITPAEFEKMPPRYTLVDRVLKWLARGLRALLHRRWPPWDEVEWFKSGKAFFVFKPEWSAYLIQRWSVPKSRIHWIPESPELAAEALHALYRQVIEDSRIESTHG